MGREVIGSNHKTDLHNVSETMHTSSLRRLKIFGLGEEL